MSMVNSELVLRYMDKNPEDTIIDRWTLFQDEKGDINTIKIENLIIDDVKVITPQLMRNQDSIIDILNQVVFLNNVAKESTKPARQKLNNIRIGPIDLFLTFDEASSFKHKCKYKKVNYSDGSIFTPTAHEIIVQHGGNDPIYHHLIWSNNELNGSYIHIDSITNEGDLTKYDGGKMSSRSFHLVSKFSWRYYGQTKFYHFDDRSDAKYWPILLTSEGLLYETDEFNFKRVCQKENGKIEVLNILTS